jgi:hypothetical protein
VARKVVVVCNNVCVKPCHGPWLWESHIQGADSMLHIRDSDLGWCGRLLRSMMGLECIRDAALFANTFPLDTPSQVKHLS